MKGYVTIYIALKPVPGSTTKEIITMQNPFHRMKEKRSNTIVVFGRISEEGNKLLKD